MERERRGTGNPPAGERAIGKPPLAAIAAAILSLVALLLLLSACGSTDSTGTSIDSGQTDPGQASLRVAEFELESEAVGRGLDVSVIGPTGEAPEPRPLLVFLHGAGGSNESFLSNAAVLGGLERLGPEAPVVAFPDGEESWWHKRESGDWGRYVVREVVPAVARRFDVDPRRVAIGGISMGGYGAYHLGILYQGRFCAVGGHSAGLWLDESEEFPGAFDGPDDYRRHDVLAAVRADPDAFGPIPVWNDYGDQDWFVPGNEAFVAALERGNAKLTAHVWPGGHDSIYWDSHWPQYLDFYASALGDC